MSYQFEAPPMYADEILGHQAAFEQDLIRVFKSTDTLIYIGWHTYVPLLSHYRNHFRRMVLIEVWPANARAAGIIHPNLDIIEGNVLDMRKDDTWRNAGIVWQQGPEHVASVAAREIIRYWQMHAGSIILEAPNGYRNQGAEDDNPFETHRSVWSLDKFESLGFRSVLFMNPENSGAIIGYWTPDVQWR